MKRIYVAIAIIFLINVSIAFSLSYDYDDGLQDSPWPMFCHDVKHTGRSPYNTSGNPGTILWRFEVEGRMYSSPAIAKDGTIYVGGSSLQGPLYAIYPNGTEKWHFQTNPPYGEIGVIDSSPAIAEDGTIYVGSLDKNLYALNPDGTLKWKFETNGMIFSSPAIAEDGTIYVGSHDHNLYAIYPDGTLKWKFEAQEEIRASPAIGDDGTIYVGSWDGYLYAVNPNGTLKWKFKIEEPLAGIQEAPAIGKDGIIYVGTFHGMYGSWGYLYAINPNGTLKWKFETGVILGSPSIGEDGTIYIGAGNYSYPLDERGILYAINPDGTEKWRIVLANDTIESSPVIGKDGVIYTGKEDLYAIGGIKIMKPRQGFLYFNDKEIMPTKGTTIIIGKVNVEIYAFHEENVSKVEFYIGDRVVGVDYDAPFEMLIDKIAFGKYILKAKAYYNDGIETMQEMDVFVFNV